MSEREEREVEVEIQVGLVAEDVVKLSWRILKEKRN